MRPFGNPYCLLYADSLDNLVQDVQCHLQSRWQKNPRSKITKLWWDNFVPMGFFVVAATGLPVLVIVLASECHTWELDAVFSNLSQGVSPYRYGLNSNSVLWVPPGCEMHSNPVLLETDWQPSTRNSPLVSNSQPHVPLLQFFLPASLPLGFRVVTCTDNGCRRTHDVKQSEKMIPLFTGEFAYCQHVWELVLGVNIFWILNWFCQTTNQAQLCGFGHVSHRPSASNYHLDHCFIILTNVKQGAKVRRFNGCGNVIHIE